MESAIEGAGKYQVRSTPDYVTGGGKPGLTTYFPLILIVAFLVVGSCVLQFRGGAWDWKLWMADFMGGFFLVFGFFKFLDWRGFADAYQIYDVIAAKFCGSALVYPLIEIGQGLAFLIRINLFWINVAALNVMLIGSIGVLWRLLQKRQIRCACLGTVF